MSGDGSRDGEERLPRSTDDPELSARLLRLEARLGEAKASPRQGGPGGQANGGPSPIGTAVRYSAEFVGGPIVGAALGWAVDRFFGVSPWGMIGMLLLGFAAGIYNVMRSSGFIRPGVKADGGDA